MLKGVTGREFDVIAAWSVDHPGRSLQTLELAYEPWRFRDPTMMKWLACLTLAKRALPCPVDWLGEVVEDGTFAGDYVDRGEHAGTDA